MRITAFAFTFILASFITGDSDLYSDIPVFVLSCILCGAFSINFKKSAKKNMLNLSACILIFIFGVFYNGFGIQRIENSADNYFKNNSGEITGVVCSDINAYDTRSEFYVKTDDNTVIKVKYLSLKGICTGDTVKITDSKLYKISSENRLKKINTRLLGKNCLLYTEVKSENLEVTGIDKLYIPMHYAYKLKKNTFYKLLRFMEYEEAALAQAIFTSDSTHLGWEMNDMLTKTGTIHISTVSGFHFALLGSLILFILKIFVGSHRKRVIILSVIMTGFAFYTGLSLPVLRALFAFLIISFSDILNIKQMGKNSIFMVLMAAFILHSPMLVYDISFILTLVSNAAILFFCTPVSELQIENRKRTWLPVNTVVVTLVMLPFVFSIFGRISVVSIVANYLVEFTMAPILLLTGLTAIFTPLAPILSVILRLFLKYFLFVIKLMSVPESFTPQIPFSLTSGIFVTVFAISIFYIFSKRKYVRFKSVAIAVCAFVCVVYSMVASGVSDKAYVTFFGDDNTGVIISKNSHHVAIGTTSDLYYYSSSSALRQNEQIDLWILTDELDTEISEDLFKKYKIKETVSYEKYKPFEKYYDFRDMKITVNADYGNILYVLFQYGNEKLYISNRLDFAAYTLKNLSDCDVILTCDADYLLEIVKIPESVNVNSVMPYSVGIFDKNGIEFK